MTRFLVLSSGAHVALLAGLVVGSTLLNKPRMSYYAIDLVSSLPPGSVTGGGPAIQEAPQAPPTPVDAIEEHKHAAKDVFRVPKKKDQVVVQKKVLPRKKGLNLKAALAALDKNTGRTGTAGSGNGGPVGAGGSGVVGEAGPSFPYPWYLKQIADRLNEKWRPPQDFQADMLCQVAFVIHKDGQVTDTSIEKSSGDGTFDQLAHRAVLYSNPLPPLPAGFPDETLRVHMKFVGKPQ